MALTDTAYLVVDLNKPGSSSSTTGTFELSVGLEATREINKEYLINQAGQSIDTLSDIGGELLSDFDATPSRRRAYSLDAGGGADILTLQFEYTPRENDANPPQWGDGSASGSPTKTDATGIANATAARQVLAHYLGQGRSDSGGQVRLHIGEWTDGAVHSQGTGVFERPMQVTIRSANLSTDLNRPGTVEGSLELQRVSTAIDLDDLNDFMESALEDLQDIIPDE